MSWPLWSIYLLWQSQAFSITMWRLSSTTETCSVIIWNAKFISPHRNALSSPSDGYLLPQLHHPLAGCLQRRSMLVKAEPSVQQTQRPSWKVLVRVSREMPLRLMTMLLDLVRQAHYYMGLARSYLLSRIGYLYRWYHHLKNDENELPVTGLSRSNLAAADSRVSYDYRSRYFDRPASMAFPFQCRLQLIRLLPTVKSWGSKKTRLRQSNAPVCFPWFN